MKLTISFTYCPHTSKPLFTFLTFTSHCCWLLCVFSSLASCHHGDASLPQCLCLIMDSSQNVLEVMSGLAWQCECVIENKIESRETLKQGVFNLFCIIKQCWNSVLANWLISPTCTSCWQYIKHDSLFISLFFLMKFFASMTKCDLVQSRGSQSANLPFYKICITGQPSLPFWIKLLCISNCFICHCTIPSVSPSHACSLWHCHVCWSRFSLVVFSSMQYDEGTEQADFSADFF